MTITTTLKARDDELRRLDTNRDRIVRNLGKRLDRVALKVSADGAPARTATLADVLDWRFWSDREIEMLADLVTGELRQMSTIDPDGNFCDLEIAK